MHMLPLVPMLHVCLLPWHAMPVLLCDIRWVRLSFRDLVLSAVRACLMLFMRTRALSWSCLFDTRAGTELYCNDTSLISC
jgi:hypothetical protein